MLIAFCLGRGSLCGAEESVKINIMLIAFCLGKGSLYDNVQTIFKILNFILFHP